MSIATKSTMNRAQFLKVAAGGALAGALACTAGAALADTPVDQIAWDEEADVVVCDCGTAGAPAAIEVAQAGCSVYLFEKRDWVGGCMRRCGGGFMTAGTTVQKKLGIGDTPEMMCDHLTALAGDYGDPELIKTFCDNAAPTFDWTIAPAEEGGLGGEPLDEWEFAGQAYVAPTTQQSQTGGYIEGQADGAAMKVGLAAGAAAAYPVLGNNGGLRISPKSEVLGWDGEPLGRLYGGRALAGGYAGESYPSCGFYAGTGIVFGRIAGQQAAALTNWDEA